jgi:acetolactate synthase small subunit
MNLIEEVVDNKAFYEKLESSLQTLIDRYKVYPGSEKKDRLFILNNFSRDVERLANLLNNYGYTYSPADVADISEETFEVAVDRILQGFQDFIDKGDSNLETINVDIKNLLTLIDKHKAVSEHFI